MAINEVEFIQTARQNFKDSRDALSTIRELEVEDLNFLNGDQWPSEIERSRAVDQRPCLKINKLPSFLDQVEGEQRQNRPSIKVRPVDSAADPDTAEVLTGHIRNIEQTSQADVAYDTAFGSAAACGEGYFRITVDYADDDVFEQDIRIKRIANNFSVFYDPMAQEIDLSDGRYEFVTEWISHDEFKKKWPNKPIIDFENASEDTKVWVLKERVRIAEYFLKEAITKTIWQVKGGQVIDSTVPDENGQPLTEAKLRTDGVEILQSREVKTHKIVWYKISGDTILEGPKDWPGRYYPIIPVWGKELNIEGKRIVRGVVRHAKDSQRLYNYSRSNNAETVALAPKTPYLLTPEQLGEHKSQWDQAHIRNYAYLLYDSDQTAGGPPQRQFPNQLNTALISEIEIADQELHDTTGLQGASMGERTNEKSGIAVRERKLQGNIGNYAYIDNLVRSLTYAGKVLVDLIPRIYTTERTLRLLGEDGSVSTVAIRPGAKIPSPQENIPKEERIYDITTGKYDVTVSVGPSYATQREEAAEGMTNFIGAQPEMLVPLIGDLVAKNMDWPGADQISDRLKKLLPPGVADQESSEGAPEGPTLPGEGAPPPIDPIQKAKETMGEADLEIAQVKLNQEKAKLDQEKQKLEGLRLENELKRAKITNERKGPERKKTDKD